MFKRWSLLVFLFLCSFAARASTVTTTCGANSTTLTGTNISSSCTLSTYYSAVASLSTSPVETTASVSASGPEIGHFVGTVLASASFTVDETWLILGGTGSAELMYNPGLYSFFNGQNSNGLPPFLTMSAGPPGDPNGDAVINVSGLNISDGNIEGLETGQIAFTFGVPFSFVANASLYADDNFGDGGYASIGLVTGTQTYTIPNANTVDACSVCPNSHSPWEIFQPGGNFASATLMMTAVDTSTPEPSFAGPLLILLLAFALWEHRHAMRRRFMTFHLLSPRAKLWPR